MSIKWFAETGGAVVSSPVLGIGGTLFAGCRDGNVYAIKEDTGEVVPFLATGGSLKRATGSKIWEVSTGDAVIASPAVCDHGDGPTAFVVSSGNKLYAVDAAKGEKRWDFATEGSLVSC